MFDSLLVAKLFQAFVDMRQVVRRHVVDEVARNLVVANAAVEPAHENREVRDRGKGEGAPVRVEKCLHREWRTANHGSYAMTTGS